MDLVVRGARVRRGGEWAVLDLGISGGRIVAVEERLEADGEVVEAGGRVVVPGLVETHIHLDKTRIMDRCRAEEGTLAEAVRETAAAKRGFTAEDVFARGRETLEQCIGWGTQRMRTHVEVDPRIGLRGLEGVEALALAYRWAVEVEVCAFPQEGLTDDPGTDALLVEALRRGVRVIGGAPYVDVDPRGQIRRVFALAREWDADVDLHLDLADGTAGMQAEFVCRMAEEHGMGGRVAVGHCTQLSFLEPERLRAVAGTLARAGVAVTILPSTDLYLTGRGCGCAVPRGVAPAGALLTAGVNCSVATNNVLNPFTPYGDGSLVRMANLCANVCQMGRAEELAECLEMVTGRAARLMRVEGYGVAMGARADLVCLDAGSAAEVVAGLAPPVWGIKDGRRSFSRAGVALHGPGAVAHQQRGRGGMVAPRGECW